MAKEIWKIRNFGRGLIQTSGEGNSPQDSASSLKGFDSSNQSKLVNGNALKITSTLGDAGTELDIGVSGNQSNVGRGLIAFSTDYPNFEDAPADGTGYDPTHYIVGTEEDSASYWILNIENENTISAASTHLLKHTSGNDVIPYMFYDSGVLRISSGNWGDDNQQNLWRGYINRKYFSGNAKSYDYRGWYQSDAEIKSPQAYTAQANGHNRVTSGSGAYTPGNMTNVAGDIEIYLQVAASTVTNSLWEGTWDFAVSYVYDGNQESLLHYLYSGAPGNGLAIDGDKTVNLTVNTENEADQKGNLRFTAIKVYCKKQGNVGFGTNNWYLLGNFDIDTGAEETHRETEGTAWSNNDGYNTHYASTGDMEEPVLNNTYADETGHLAEHPDTGVPYPSLYARYRTAAIVNRRLYIGHTKIEDRTQDGYTIGRDSIYRSPVNQFDKIPQTFKIESQVNDGDEIIHLESYADRLLEFKSNRLN